MTAPSDTVASEAGEAPGGAAAKSLPARLMPVISDRGVQALAAVTASIGVGGAMVVTTVSLFLTDRLAVSPLLVGVFFAGRAASEVATDLVVGALSDRLSRRQVLLSLCSLSSAVGAVAFVVLHSFIPLFIAAAVFFGFGGSTFPQLFAYTRDFADRRNLNAGLFNGTLRAITSAAWIIGPPVAFAVIASRGFSLLYGVAAVMYLVGGVISLALPSMGNAAAPDERHRISLRGLSRNVWAIIAVTGVLLTVNMMYQIDLSLYVTKALHHGAGLVGLLLGISAAIEIPIVIGIGWLADRVERGRLVLAGCVTAAAFFGLLPFAHSAWALLVLQIPNAFWTSVALSIPVLILQDLLRDRTGLASSLYSAGFRIGAFLGGAIAGVSAEWFGFAHVFLVCSGLSGCAVLLTIYFGRQAWNARPSAA